MTISRIARTIGASVTLKLNATAAAMRAKGDPVIHLGGGEPKSKAPESALIAATEMLKTGEIRYAPASGIPDLKKAVVKYTEEFYGRRVEPANVMASGGAKQAIMTALHAVLDPGDEVIFPAPYWVSYPDMVKICGAVPVQTVPADGSYYPTIQDIKRVKTARTKAMIINSPNNPSGAVYSEEFIADIVRYCEQNDIYLLMDDIYHRLLFDGRKPVSCYDFASDDMENSKLIVINGVSKQYAMTGFRIGWAVGAKNLIRVMGNIQGHETSGPSSLSQRAAVAAIEGDQSSVEDLRSTLERNRNILVEKLSAIDGVKITNPDATFYLFADFSAFDKDSTRLANRLLEEVRVVTVPGAEFGFEGYLRLSYCGAIADVTTGVERIRWLLDPSAPKELKLGDQVLVRD